VSENAPQDEEVGQNVDHLCRLELAGDTDRAPSLRANMRKT